MLVWLSGSSAGVVVREWCWCDCQEAVLVVVLEQSPLHSPQQTLSVSCVAEPCPPEAAVCLLNGSKPVNLGKVRDGPQWTGGVTVLKYVDGDLCPDKIQKRSTIIRFTCSDSQVVS